jgi:ATP-dependent Lon protease
LKFFQKNEPHRPDPVLELLRNKVSDAKLPAAIGTIAERELDALARIHPSTAEYTIGMAYVEYLASLPWNIRTPDNLDLVRAEHILNENHYGLASIKDRVLEHLAVGALVTNRKPRILVVDDEEIARKNLAHVLSREGYDVVNAADGTQALHELGTGDFDAVLTDLRMGPVNGLDVLERVKMRSPDTKVIVITGFASVPSAIESMQRGAFHYISKPFNLDEVRDTVRRALAARGGRLRPKGSVLCFAGPPGTGKTSLGRSIARALGREFSRIALGGIKDEADIRGHRRTYVGAKPGRIIDELRRVESANPVIMLDELDKIGRDVKGDPASALLEVLDPEQNRSFTDHYLDAPFDLSGVMFILTANVLDTVPAALRDRLEVVEFSGYTQEEKVAIASKFICPRQIREKGLPAGAVAFTDDALMRIIQDHTREAGIRNLERKIAAVCRKIAKTSVLNGSSNAPVRIDACDVEHFLGKRKYRSEALDGQDRIGVVTGLVRTEAGAEIIFVEAAGMRGSKELILTGSLGDVMRESALAALSYIRSNSASFGIPDDFFEQRDIHVHVPSGAIQKDGPSAGITILVALVSLLTNRPVRRDVALTGEITLTGRLLPVGGIREKALAAKRARVGVMIVPSGNREDVDALPVDLRNDVDIRLAETAADVVRQALV